jgi:hypothetical protein
MVVVIGIAALMLGLAVPAVNMLLNSFESESGAKSIVSSAMASARAIAAKEQRYAGIRFQKRYDPNNPIGASQYIIFIVHDPNRTRLANGFRAVDGIQPIKLPDSIGVMDMLYSSIGGNNPDVNFVNSTVFTDTTSFSVIFSPSGKLVFHDVRARNRDGAGVWPSTIDSSLDNVFNARSRIADSVNPTGMFIQDNDTVLTPGLIEELSRNSFIIYDTKKFRQAYNINKPYSGYLSQLNRIYINPYTGTIINEK